MPAHTPTPPLRPPRSPQPQSQGYLQQQQVRYAEPRRVHKRDASVSLAVQLLAGPSSGSSTGSGVVNNAAGVGFGPGGGTGVNNTAGTGIAANLNNASIGNTMPGGNTTSNTSHTSTINSNTLSPASASITLTSSTSSPLPPLFPTPTPELSIVHAKVYNLIALALRAYVQTWYSRLTPRDRQFLPAINRDVVAPILRPILTRLTEDTEGAAELVLLGLPVILATHVRTYWAARASVESGLGEVQVGEAYHARLPLLSVERGVGPLNGNGNTERNAASSGSLGSKTMSNGNPESNAKASGNPNPNATSSSDAVTPNPNLDEQQCPPEPYRPYVLSPTYLAALTDALMALHLPPAEYACDAERLIVREVLARSVLSSVGRRIGAPWFLAQLGLKFIKEKRRKGVGAVRDAGEGEKAVSAEGTTAASTSDSASSTHPAKEATAVDKDGRDKPDDQDEESPPLPSAGAIIGSIIDALVRAYQVIITLSILVWNSAASTVALYTAAPAPAAKYRRLADPWLALLHALLGLDERAALYPPPLATRIVWTLISTLITLCSPLIDRIAPHIVTTYVLTPRTAGNLCDLLERILFPNGYPTPSPPDPSPDEAAELDRAFRDRVQGRVGLGKGKAGKVSALFTPSGPRGQSATSTPTPIPTPTADLLIDPISDGGCNAHLVGMLYSAIVAALVPELVAGREGEVKTQDEEKAEKDQERTLETEIVAAENDGEGPGQNGYDVGGGGDGGQGQRQGQGHARQDSQPDSMVTPDEGEGYHMTRTGRSNAQQEDKQERQDRQDQDKTKPQQSLDGRKVSPRVVVSDAR